MHCACRWRLPAGGVNTTRAARGRASGLSPWRPMFEERDLMRCHPPKLAVVLLCVAAILAGCAPQQPLYFRNNGDLSHYVGMSQTIDNADVSEPPFSEVEGTIRPFSVGGPAPNGTWDLTLESTIRFALQNAKVMRQIGGQVQGPPTFLTSNPGAATTIYDPAIAETDPRFGINAGLSLFDPAVEHGPLLGAQSRAAERQPGLRRLLADRAESRRGSSSTRRCSRRRPTARCSP